MSKINVFLSYARNEQTFPAGAAAFVQSLTETLLISDPDNEYVIFLDEEGIKSSDDWRTRILTEIKGTHVFLFTGTQDWFESQWCVRELKEFVRVGKKSKKNGLPLGRALLPLVSQKIEIRNVPWLRRFNAQYVNRLIQTRQSPKNLPKFDGVDTNIDPKTVAQEIIGIKSTLSNLSLIRTPGLGESWNFLPIGLKFISITILLIIIGIFSFFINNYISYTKNLEIQQGKFREVVLTQQTDYSKMRVGINTLLPSGLPSLLSTLQTQQGQAFSRQWGFAINDVERYFSPMASCLQQKTCVPVDHKELCVLAEKTIEGNSRIYSFFNEGGGGRGFTFVIGGSKLIFEVPPSSTIHEPTFRYTKKFHQLACKTIIKNVFWESIKNFFKIIFGGKAPVIKSMGEIPSQTNTNSCPNDLKLALTWADTWLSQAKQGQNFHLSKLKNSLIAMERELEVLGGANMIIEQFPKAIKELQEDRHRNRPDLDPDNLDYALINRLTRDINNSQNVARPMADCIQVTLANNPKNPDDFDLGAALLLDTFFNPKTIDWVSTIRSILGDPTRRDKNSLRKLIGTMESNYDSFLEWSKGRNLLNCQQVMKEMYENPGFQFSLRNRRDPNNNMRILRFSQHTVTSSIGKLRESCGP